MVYIKTSKNRYTTNHPKDQAARRRQETEKQLKKTGCSRNELDNPTERNIQKCMQEMKVVSGGQNSEIYKVDSRFLGEDTNLDKHRRR